MRSIRKATTADAKQISAIIKVLDYKNYLPGSIANVEKYIELELYYVIELKGEVLGAFSYRFYNESCQILTIASDIKNKGLGTAMLNHIVEKCKENNIKKVWCWSLKRYNAGAFYEKMGFDEKFVAKKQFFGEDTYFFGKVLNNGESSL